MTSGSTARTTCLSSFHAAGKVEARLRSMFHGWRWALGRPLHPAGRQQVHLVPGAGLFMDEVPEQGDDPAPVHLADVEYP